MAQLEVETRRQILDVTVALLDAARGSRVRLRDIADAANVAIPTIYYHYADRQSLLAEAQAVRLLGIFDEITDATSPTVNAITAADQDGYVEAVAETREPYWKPDNREAVWRSVEAMVEIRHDPEVFSRVSSVIENLFASVSMRLSSSNAWAGSRIKSMPASGCCSTSAPHSVRSFGICARESTP